MLTHYTKRYLDGIPLVLWAWHMQSHKTMVSATLGIATFMNLSGLPLAVYGGYFIPKGSIVFPNAWYALLQHAKNTSGKVLRDLGQCFMMKMPSVQIPKCSDPSGSSCLGSPIQAVLPSVLEDGAAFHLSGQLTLYSIRRCREAGYVQVAIWLKIHFSLLSHPS
jgi:hypothetical protein